MLNGNWTKVAGFTNMGEDDETIAMKKSQDIVSIAYAAYGGIKVVELKGVTDISKSFRESDISSVISECGDDWEVAVPVTTNCGDVIVTVDDMSNATVIPVGGTGMVNTSEVEVVSAEEYDADMCSELDTDLLVIFCV